MSSQEKTQNQQSDFYSQDPSLVTLVKQPYKVLLSFKSPVRIFKKRSKEFYTNIFALVFLVCIILLFANQITLILAVIAFSFLVYVLNTVKPEEVEHKFTTKGIETSKKKYLWDQLGRYWFEKEDNQKILYIENFVGLPTRLIILINDKQKINKIKTILNKYLIEEKPELTQIEKASNWLGEKFILDNQVSSKPKVQKKSKINKTLSSKK